MKPPFTERCANRWRCSPREVPSVIAGAVFGIVGWGVTIWVFIHALGAPDAASQIDPGQVLPTMLFFL